MNDLEELIYRLDERFKSLEKSLDQGVTEIKADIKVVKNDLDAITKQVAVDNARLNEIQDKLKTARQVSWSAVATSVIGAIVAFFTGRG